MSSSQNDDVAIYKDHCIVYPDGSPAGVPVGHSANTIPHPYVEFATKHFTKAHAQTHWDQSIAWRTNRYDLLTKPNPRLREMEALQPMYIHGISKEGHVVLYEPMRMADFDQMFQNGFTIEHHVERAVYLTEFVRHELCQGTGRYPVTTDDVKDFAVVYVKDLQDLDIPKYFTGDAFKSRTEFFDIARFHYPGMFQHAFCLHLPRWMAAIARKILQQILWGFSPPELVYDLNRLSQVIEPHQIPTMYGGTSEYALGEHPLHKRYLEFTEQYLQKQPQAMTKEQKLSSSVHSKATSTTASPETNVSQVHDESAAESLSCASEHSQTAPTQQQKVVHPIVALVSTLWLGVWSFWANLRSLAATAPPPTNNDTPTAILQNTSTTTTTQIPAKQQPYRQTKKRISFRRLFKKGRSFETVETTTESVI